MKITHKLRKFVPYLLILSLVFGQLACGFSTNDVPASSVPPKESETSDASSQAGENQQTGDSGTTSLKEPTVPPDSQLKPLIILEQGFGQDDHSLGYGFILENPNKNIAIENIQYQVAAYDANGTLVETHSDNIELILPGDKIGFSGSIYLSEDVIISKVEIQIDQGNPVSSQPTSSLVAKKVAYLEDESYSRATGVISNPSDRSFESIRVSAVAYNDAGEIIGGGNSYLNFILPMGSTGVEIDVSSAGSVSKVELYPLITSLAQLTSEGGLPQGAQNIAMLKQGYGQDNTQVGYGMLIHNPNSGFVVEYSRYHINLYDGDGNIVSVEEGYINLLLPSQKLGIAGVIYIGNDAIQVGSAEFQLLPGEYVVADSIPTFSTENVTFLGDGSFSKVTGEIRNPYAKDLSDLMVFAIGYNEFGEIIGGGFNFLGFVPANGKAAIEVSYTGAGIPSTVELYSSLYALSDIE